MNILLYCHCQSNAIIAAWTTYILLEGRYCDLNSYGDAEIEL